MAVRDRPWVAVLLLALTAAAPLPDVISVAPSGDGVPERLLRISLGFAAPPGDAVMPMVTLRDEEGVIAGALLEQPLWSPDRRTLTLLLDPGRVKTGLVRHDEAGFPLRPGTRVALSVGDAPVHVWTVTGGGCTPPDIEAWTLAPPRAGTDTALALGFPGPIDALSRELIAVVDEAGRRVPGEARLLDGERRWQFVPVAPWARARFRLVVHPRLENPCGDEIGEPFEHPVSAGLASARAVVGRWFAVE